MRVGGGRTGEEEVEEQWEGLTRRGRGKGRSLMKKHISQLVIFPLIYFRRLLFYDMYFLACRPTSLELGWPI